MLSETRKNSHDFEIVFKFSVVLSSCCLFYLEHIDRGITGTCSTPKMFPLAVP